MRVNGQKYPPLSNSLGWLSAGRSISAIGWAVKSTSTFHCWLRPGGGGVLGLAVLAHVFDQEGGVEDALYRYDPQG